MLVLATTAPVNGEFPTLLTTDIPCNKKSTPGEERRKYVRKQIPASKDPKVNQYIQDVKALSDGQLTMFLSKIKVVREGNAQELLTRVREKITERFHEKDSEGASREFLGFIQEQVAIALDQGQGAQISQEDVHLFVQNMRDERNPRTLQFRHVSTVVDPDKERSGYQNSTFYRQLEAIDSSPDLFDTALVDYLRNMREHAEWARHNEVSHQNIRDYREQVHDRWRLQHLAIANQYSDLEDKALGRKICFSVLQSQSPRLRDASPPGHVFRGTCHELANASPRIGWHPRWKELFQ